MTLTVVAIVAFAAGSAITAAFWLVLARWAKRLQAPAPFRPREALKSKGDLPRPRQGFVSGAAGITAEDVDEMSDVVIAARLAAHRQRAQEKHVRLIQAGQAIAAERAAFADRSLTSWD